MLVYISVYSKMESIGVRKEGGTKIED